jgi:hypothetical protein
VSQLTQSLFTQTKGAKAFRGELTADYKQHPCRLPFGPSCGRSKWLPAILWRAANPELVSGDNSAVALLARIKEERAAVVRSGRKIKAEV